MCCRGDVMHWIVHLRDLAPIPSDLANTDVGKSATSTKEERHARHVSVNYEGKKTRGMHVRVKNEAWRTRAVRS